MDDVLDMLWVEKYRPKELSDVVLIDAHRNFFEKCLERKSIPNLLFCGPPGGGKSCTARILVDKLLDHEMDLMQYNGSNERSIQKVRDDIEGFLRTPVMSANHKIIYVEEFDGLTSDAQKALKDIFEKYHENGRFICCTNHKSKIDSALISRFQVFEFKRLSDEFILSFCEKILRAEDIKYNLDDVKLLVQNISPDVRKIVNTLNQNAHNGELKNINSFELIEVEKKLLGLICQICSEINNDSLINRNVADVQDTVSSNSSILDYLSLFEQLFNSNIPLWGKIEVSKYCNQFNSCAIPSIHFMSMIYSIIVNGKNYIKTFGESK